MNIDDLIHLLEALVIPIVLFALSRYLKSNDRHNTNLYNKLDQFRQENTLSIKELGSEIKDTLQVHSLKLDDHNGRISTLEGMQAYGRRRTDK